MSIEITLSEVEKAIARTLARLRFLNNRGAGVVNNRIGPQSDELTDLEGIGGELAFCRLYNSYPDFSISVRKGGFDCVVKEKRVDVKTTKYKNGKLLVVTDKKTADVDYFALMVGEFPTYRFVGVALAAEVLLPERIGTVGHGPTYIMLQSELSQEF